MSRDRPPRGSRVRRAEDGSAGPHPIRDQTATEETYLRKSRAPWYMGRQACRITIDPT